MDWTVWASIAQIVGSGAIVVTLIYLSLQVRQNTDAMQATAREEVTKGDVGLLYRWVDCPEIGLLLRKESSLTELEASRLAAYLVAFMRLKELNFRQYKAGILDRQTWANYRSSIVNGPLAHTQARSWWLNYGKHIFDRELSDQISNDLNAAPMPPSFASLFGTPTGNNRGT